MSEFNPGSMEPAVVDAFPLNEQSGEVMRREVMRGQVPHIPLLDEFPAIAEETTEQ